MLIGFSLRCKIITMTLEKNNKHSELSLHRTHRLVPRLWYLSIWFSSAKRRLFSLYDEVVIIESNLSLQNRILWGRLLSDFVARIGA